jgi:hypothetical protein
MAFTSSGAIAHSDFTRQTCNTSAVLALQPGEICRYPDRQ